MAQNLFQKYFFKKYFAEMFILNVFVKILATIWLLGTIFIYFIQNCKNLLNLKKTVFFMQKIRQSLKIRSFRTSKVVLQPKHAQLDFLQQFNYFILTKTLQSAADLKALSFHHHAT